MFYNQTAQRSFMTHLTEVRSNIMEAEFVNEYIEQLNKKLHDLTSQNVLLETRVAHLSKQLAGTATELQKLKDEQLKADNKKKPEKAVDF
jgi:cell division septum initiation protein DivIVA